MQRVLSPLFSFSFLEGEQACEGPRAFPWRKKGLTVPFLLGALISSIDQPITLVTWVFSFFFISTMLIILVCINLILAYSFVFLFLTLSSIAVMLNRTQLGM
jgi:hypothetical protein